MKTELYENSPDYIIKRYMLDPPGKFQDEDVIQLIKLRKELDEEISKLVKQRKEFNDLIEKNCTHPIERRALQSYYLTDTIGNNGWDEYTLVCRDCGKNLRKWDNRR